MKKALIFTASLLAVALGPEPSTSQASDHIDGLKTAIDNSGDITDLFTFTSPKDSGRLVLVMNVHGIAFSGSRFSNAVDYKFRIRPIDDAESLEPSTDAKRENTVVCNFSGGSILDPKQRATCKLKLADGTESLSFDTRSKAFRAGGAGELNGIRIFAGVRSDPWFLDLARTLKFNNGLSVAQTKGINGLQGQNVLSIVVAVPKQRLSGSLLAVTAQTVRK